LSTGNEAYYAAGVFGVLGVVLGVSPAKNTETGQPFEGKEYLAGMSLAIAAFVAGCFGGDAGKPGGVASLDGNLGEAFEAVKGSLFGPVDAGTVKHKFNQIVRDEKDRRDLEMSRRGPLGLALQERDRTERKDRDTRQMTLMALLSSERLREKLREMYEAFDKTRDKGRELLEAIADLREQLRRERDYLLEHAARHPETGKAIFRYADGTIKDEDGDEVSAEAVKNVGFEGTTRGEVWDAHEAREAEADQLETRVYNGMHRLDTAEGTMETGIRKDPDHAEERMDEAEKARNSVAGEFGEIGGLVEGLKERSDFGVNQAVLAAGAVQRPAVDLSDLKMGGPGPR